MRVLHFFKTYWPDTFGGIERVIHTLSKGTAEQGVEVDVLTLSDSPNPDPIVTENHRVIQAKRDLNVASTGFSMSAISKFRTLARHADVIHYHFPWPFMDVVDRIVPHGKPTVVSYHSDIVKQKYLLKLYSPLMHRFLGRADRIVASSPNYLATSPVLQRHADNVDIIPYGLDPGDYPKAADTKLEYWRSKFPDGFFLFVGVFRYYKGINTLFAAAKSSGIPVVLVGAGGEENALKDAALRDGLDNFHLVGRQSDEDKIALLSLCTGFVFPSHLRSEAFGMSLVEAAMHGKPMISCEIGTGTSYVNKHNETGLVVPPEDPSALASAMHQLWDDKDARDRLGAGARKRFEAHFSSKRMVGEYIDLYHLLAKKR